MTEDELTPEQAQADLRAWVLQQDMITAVQVRDLGLDPADPDLLSLDGSYGPDWDGPRWFAFQFTEGGVPDIVRTLNRCLSPPDVPDPVGAADWWLRPASGLGGCPIDMVGKIPDEALEEYVRELDGEF